METKILVTYASKYGATREIAEKIGEVLRQTGLQADVLPVASVRNPGSYQAVILGSAVYIGKWQKEAETFLQVHEKILADRPVWIFSSGPTGEGDPIKLVEGWRLPTALQPVADRIRPRDLTVFHGNIDSKKIGGFQSWMLKRMKKPFGDFRDWKAITAWADQIAQTLLAAEPAR